jgi:hypothetical protein
MTFTVPLALRALALPLRLPRPARGVIALAAPAFVLLSFIPVPWWGLFVWPLVAFASVRAVDSISLEGKLVLSRPVTMRTAAVASLGLFSGILMGALALIGSWAMQVPHDPFPEPASSIVGHSFRETFSMTLTAFAAASMARGEERPWVACLDACKAFLSNPLSILAVCAVQAVLVAPVAGAWAFYSKTWLLPALLGLSPVFMLILSMASLPRQGKQ